MYGGEGEVTGVIPLPCPIGKFEAAISDFRKLHAACNCFSSTVVKSKDKSDSDIIEFSLLNGWLLSILFTMLYKLELALII